MYVCICPCSLGCYLAGHIYTSLVGKGLNNVANPDFFADTLNPTVYFN